MINTIHDLAHEADHLIVSGNIEGARKLLSTIDELSHGIIDQYGRQRLPSRFVHGDHVHLRMNDAGTLKNCMVVGVNFPSESKITYDVSVKFHWAKPNKEGQPAEYHTDDDPEHCGYTCIPDVDAGFLIDPKTGY